MLSWYPDNSTWRLYFSWDQTQLSSQIKVFFIENSFLFYAGSLKISFMKLTLHASDSCIRYGFVERCVVKSFFRFSILLLYITNRTLIISLCKRFIFSWEITSTSQKKLSIHAQPLYIFCFSNHRHWWVSVTSKTCAWYQQNSPS